MSEPTNKFWMSLEQRDGAAGERSDEFAQELPVGPDAPVKLGHTRRDFFRMMGLSASAAAMACSRAPVKEVIPFLVAPEDVTPGVAVWYASTCGACPAACPTLLKTRDGRPIKVEGNDAHPWSKDLLVSGSAVSGVCASGQASVLALYDASRARAPEGSGGASVTWAALDGDVIAGLRKAAAANRGIRLVTAPWVGPSAEAAIGQFLAAFPTAKRVRTDALGGDAVAEAHLATHGLRAVPMLHFERARVIVSLDADFLGTWRSPVRFTRQYAAGRNAEALKTMSRHFQLEPQLSVTGSVADVRWTIAPSDAVPVLAALAARLGALPGAAPSRPELAADRIERLAAELGAARGSSLVVTGSADPAAQALANAINETLGNYGTTIDLAEGTILADAGTIPELIADVKSGAVDAVIFAGVNPVYSHPRGEELGAALGHLPLSVATNDRRDETAKRVRLLAPDHHAMESWGDAEPVRGLLGLSQPAVAPLFDTRSAWESLLVWAGAGKPWYDFVKARWQAEVYPLVANAPLTFGAFWDASVQQGFAQYTPPAGPATQAAFRPEAAPRLLAERKPPFGAGAELELAAFATVSLRDGRLANNGWLLELPDPITKVTWTNVVALAPSTAKRLGLGDGDVVTVAAGERRVELPVLRQPGVHPRTVAVAVGWGRTAAGKVGNGIGENAFALVDQGAVTITRTGKRVELARTQIESNLHGRPLVHETALAAFLADPTAGTPRSPASLTMWSGHKYEGHRWAMAIDLSACTGCSACLVSCQAENNVPIVGEAEVRNRREMHWLRIDRYYTGAEDEPGVVHQPMLCQHCENAPCETVCPVLATVHSAEGLNQQVYNRCVGTRYCANNCPTKVRRFNWFDYPHDEPVERMVLNPDVVVRSRGVMEKCSFCVQRIQAEKADAKVEGRAVGDGEVMTACQQSCPAGAIAFGDLNDPASQVAKLAQSGRSFKILEEINIKSSISYLTRIRNTGGSGA